MGLSTYEALLRVALRGIRRERRLQKCLKEMVPVADILRAPLR